MANRFGRIVAIGMVFVATFPAAKNKEDKTQQLKLPDDPPFVTVGEARRLTFHVSPLSGKGLLSEQTRDALKALQKLNGGAQIIHIRAFSAGNGDVRRIPQIVADVLGTKNTPLPSVSVLQAGDLPLGDAQVVLEAVSLAKKELNRDGVTFYPAEMVSDPRGDQKDLLNQSLTQLAAKMSGRPALAVTCFVSSIEGAGGLTAAIQTKFPGAAIDLVQPRRLAWDQSTACEGVAQGGTGAKKYAFTGTQVGFGSAERDAVNAVQRVDRALAAAGASRARAVVSRIYLSVPSAETEVKKQLQDSAPVVVQAVESAGSATATFAIDVIVPME